MAAYKIVSNALAYWVGVKWRKSIKVWRFQSTYRSYPHYTDCYWTEKVPVNTTDCGRLPLPIYKAIHRAQLRVPYVGRPRVANWSGNTRVLDPNGIIFLLYVLVDIKEHIPCYFYGSVPYLKTKNETLRYGIILSYVRLYVSFSLKCVQVLTRLKLISDHK